MDKKFNIFNKKSARLFITFGLTIFVLNYGNSQELVHYASAIISVLGLLILRLSPEDNSTKRYEPIIFFLYWMILVFIHMWVRNN